MSVLALKVLRVLLEYGALLWLAYVVVQLGRGMFSTLRTDIREGTCLPQQSVGTASFVVIAGEGLVGRRYPVGHHLTIGRSADNDIVLADDFVSHHHVAIDQRENSYIAEDLDSRNHTYLNDGILTGRTYLCAGDILRIGAIALRFER